jgi:hypothetical protein
MNESTTNRIDERLAAALGLHAMRLEKALRAYYDQHQASGCKCELCKGAAAALTSMANPSREFILRSEFHSIPREHCSKHRAISWLTLTGVKRQTRPMRPTSGVVPEH